MEGTEKKMLLDTSKRIRKPGGSGYGGYVEEGLANPGFVDTSSKSISDPRTPTSPAEEEMTLCWKDVSVTTTEVLGGKGCMPCIKRKKAAVPPKQILNNVSGVAKKGSCLVIMGASGSGKTTLLNVLTRRNLGSLEVKGQVLVNGRDLGEEINAVSGYIQQDDLFVGTLTVREHLWFNAVLRMKRHLPDEERKQRMEEVLQEMGLSKCEDTVIGVPGMVQGLSGGERKRLAFAAELLKRPSIMFCDEPTSGLDSFMAQSVVQSIKNLTRRGRTVLCTIHQPSSEIFAMFDEIMLMADRQIAFTGTPRDLSTFFQGLGYCCPVNFNPADFYIQTLATVPGMETVSKQETTRICDAFRDSEYNRKIAEVIEDAESRADDPFLPQMEGVTGQFGPSKTESSSKKQKRKRLPYEAKWCKQFSMCMWRSVIEARRNFKVLPARILQVVVAGLFLGTMYWQQDYDMIGVSNINGALFMLMIQVSFNVAFTIVASFSRDFPIFLKEYDDRQYSVSAYYLGRVLVDLPAVAIAAILYTLVSYWMIGLYPGVQEFFVAMAALVLMSQISVAYGHMCSALFPNPQLSLTLLPFLLGLTLLFSGFLVKETSVVIVFKPLAWISSYRYTYEALLINQWRSVTHLDCGPGDGLLNSSMSPKDTPATSWCFKDGMSVIYSFQYNPDNMIWCFVVNTAIFLVVEFLGFIALRCKAKKSFM